MVPLVKDSLRPLVVFAENVNGISFLGAYCGAYGELGTHPCVPKGTKANAAGAEYVAFLCAIMWAAQASIAQEATSVE